jgi:hypothetical protein
MTNRLEIQLGANKIVAEVFCCGEAGIPPELNVYIQAKDGLILQDICLVRPNCDINRKTMEFETNNNFVDCLVWGDSDDEGYTKKFVIGVREEEDE